MNCRVIVIFVCDVDHDEINFDGLLAQIDVAAHNNQTQNAVFGEGSNEAGVVIREQVECHFV